MAAILRPITTVSRVTLRADVVAAELDHDYIVMGASHGTIFGFNSTGNALWQRLAQPVLVRDLCDELQQRFVAEPGVIEADLIAFLSELAAREFIEVVAE